MAVTIKKRHGLKRGAMNARRSTLRQRKLPNKAAPSMLSRRTTRSKDQSDTKTRTSKRKQTLLQRPAAEAPDRSPFLELPAELRNSIYEYAALDSTALLRSNARGKLISNSPLTRSCRQVREEYLAVLYIGAPITAYVKNLDFSHIVAFLNKLSDRELAALPSVDIPSERQMLVRLEITSACPPHSDMLHRWLLRCEHPTKKGTNINVSYTARGTYIFKPDDSYASMTNPLHVPTVLYLRGGLGRPPHMGTPVGELYHAQRRVLEKMEDLEIAEGRVYEELKKVVAALEKPETMASQ